MTNIIIIGFFIIIFAFLVFAVRNTTLDKLPWLAGEKTLFTEDDVRVESFLRGNNIRTAYPKSHVVVTNKRIITSQPLLFRKNKYVLHHVITYSGSTESLNAGDLMGGFLFKGGYATLPSASEKIKIMSVKNKTTIEVTINFPNHGPLFSNEPKILIFTKDPTLYEKILKPTN